MALRGGGSLEGISSDSVSALDAFAGLVAAGFAGGFFLALTGVFLGGCLFAACVGDPASKVSMAEAARKSRLFNRFSGKR